MDAEAFTIEEIARYCSVSSSTVSGWIQQGSLKPSHANAGEDVRIRAFELLSFLHRSNLPIPAILGGYSRRVLIAEDERAMASAIQRVLKSGGFSTMIAADGFQAGSVLESFAPAVLILDLNMPEMKGMELLRYIRGRAKYSYIRVLVVSAAPEAELREASAAGADDILEKPFDNEILLSKVTGLAGVESLEAQLGA